jgi:hypothetical protein
VLGQKIVKISFVIAVAEKRVFQTLRDEVCTFLHLAFSSLKVLRPKHTLRIPG